MSDVDKATTSVPLTFSIVICTDGRAESLRNTLRSLCYQEYPHFEVCVVCGPTEDSTPEVIAQYGGAIKVAHNPERNLSISRNIGIALASGDVIAFIDDDSIPEPEWLRDLAAAYADDSVGGAGGFVYDHLGTGFQSRYTTANRMGRATIDWAGPVTHLSFPLTANFPHLLGANSSFRRKSLLEVGGFDEEYDYYLDETDVAVRLVDAGWVITIIDGAYVHHKFLPSSMRSVDGQYRILRTWYSVIKNKIYFSLRHHGVQYGLNEVINDARDFIEGHARDLSWVISQGFLPDTARLTFWNEVEQAWAVGLQRGFENRPRLLRQETIERWASPFTLFPTLIPDGGRRTFVFVSQEYTPGKMGGIGRYTHELASGIAELGHHVHVIAKADGHDRIDYEHGVWVHRLLDKPAHVAQPRGMRLPAHIWDRATTVTRELDAIAAKRPITTVSAPIWDVEGIAVLTEGRYALVTTLHTSMAPYLDANPGRAADKTFVRTIAQPMIEAETRLMRESYKLIANSHAIVDELEQMYKLRFDPERLALVPHGMSDWTLLLREAPEPLPEGALRLLFVGRLEERKGIDVLLACAKRVLGRHPHVYLDVVGNDTIPGPTGQTFRKVFEADRAADSIRERVTFYGNVSDERLRGFYAAADIFVAPSRFESFGLMLLEGLMFGKPVIGCAAGGMVEVVEDGVSGLLAQPGDVASLEAALERLINDTTLRARLGAAARQRYEERFTARTMANSMIVELEAAAANTLKRQSIHEGAVAAFETPNRMPGHPTSLASVSRATGQPGKSPRPRLTIVAPMLARYDAISTAVLDTYRILKAQPAWEVTLLTTRNDFAEIPAQIVGDLTELLLHPAYLAADLLLYHYGVFNPLFDALVIGNGHAAQAVYFHNVTPQQFAPASHRDIIQESFRQVANLNYADAIWAVSQTNVETLAELGITGDHVSVLPLIVDEPPILMRPKRRADRLDILFIGRAVPSKGLLDLVKALRIVRQDSPLPVRLRMAGSLEWSDEDYLAEVRAYIERERLTDVVELCGPVDHARWKRLFQESHLLAIPSYHEGFCKPVIEGLRSGCIPVGYAAYNLPVVANGLGRLVEPGDIQALARALSETLGDVARAGDHPEAPALRLDRGLTSLREFDALRLDHVNRFSFDQISTSTLDAVKQALGSKTAPQGETHPLHVGASPVGAGSATLVSRA